MDATRKLAVRKRCRGASILEACASLALAGAVAATAVSGLRGLDCGLRVEAARSSLVSFLAEARRTAYAGEVEAGLAVDQGRGGFLLEPSGRRRDLPGGVRVVAAPADGRVSFHASGLADNATIGLGCGASVASVVVNQRGVIR